MKNKLKILIFVVVFTVVFWLLRGDNGVLVSSVPLFVADVSGLGWLYSAIGLIFALMAAFVILYEAERWTNLNEAVNNEISAIGELIIWSKNFSGEAQAKLIKGLRDYLNLVINDEWEKSRQGEKSAKIDRPLTELNQAIVAIARELPETADQSFGLFSEILRTRADRIHFSLLHTPKILINTLVFSDFLLIAFSFLIGINDINLAYLFTLGISILGYIIYLVVVDLDRPLRPGGWHLTTEDYQELLAHLD
ncbi:MAG: hypothetical protein WC385_02185 [Candidatus Paceibacterota bacterium]|jgi:hypothetical protein